MIFDFKKEYKEFYLPDSFDFHQDYIFSVVVKPNGKAFVYSRTFDESYVQPVLVPFEALAETESHGLRLH